MSLAFAGAAAAQQSGDTIALDTITVTSTKRPEADATLPIATTILTPETVPPQSLDPVAEIARQSPGANYMDFSRFGESYMTMRGIATLGAALNALDNTVGFSVDGVPTSLSGLGAPLMDVERIEVLRGPQGTVFGRNALGGSINVINTPADGRREFRVNAEACPDGYGFAEGTAGGWIVPGTVAGRGVVRLQRFDGDIPNVVTGDQLGGVAIGAARGSLRFTPDETLTIDVSGGYSRDNRNNAAYVLLEAPGFPVSGEDALPINRRTIANGVVKVSKEFDALTLTSITSYQDIQLYNFGDFTDALIFGRATGLPLAYLSNPLQDKIGTDERDRIFNQELRLNSKPGAPWSWVLGANYFNSDYSFRRSMNTAFWPTLNGNVDNTIDSQTIAAFGDVSVPLGGGWELSGGLRLAHDHQSLDGRYVSNGYPGTVPALVQSNSFSDTYLTGRAALSYRWTASTMTYASVARGYSSGGFEKSTQYAAYGIPATPFQPAKVWTYEVGGKAEIVDGVRASAAVFYNDVKDGQLSAFDVASLQVFLTNQDYRSYGAEAGLTARLADGLDLIGSVAVIRSRLVDVTSTSALAGARNGNAVPQVPAATANLGLSYRFSAGWLKLPGDFTAKADYQFVGTRYADVANSGRMNAYHIVDAQLGWEAANVRLYAFGRNLFDERALSYALPYAPGVTAAYIGRGRVIGIGTSITW